ncbi:Pol polyprotein [Gossypium australe]|uniref:Pol polyprotein n=1 Tax=Gossypium australe TaxID=47621 RepID=A0A5B6V8Y9_9ROSI|nr:Pol polyprotein [Gossypium australe]
MKLNLKKCAFGVRAGRSLGFMISEREIEVNPKMVKVIMEIPYPRAIKDIQCLTGKMNRLHSANNNKTIGASRLHIPLKELMTQHLTYIHKSVHETNNSKSWLVYVNCFAIITGSGAGALIIDPNGSEWQYIFSFGFQTSNNIIEYEVLVSGLQLARQLGAKDLIVHTDSQLVVEQMNREYDVKEAVPKKYHAITSQLLTGFDKA